MDRRRPAPARGSRCCGRWVRLRAKVEGAAMNRVVRVALTVSALSLGLALAGCESFDPTNILDLEIFNTKKKLQGERHRVFREGTRGVPHGVRQELVKGYQPPPEEQPPQAAAAPVEEPKPKPKPKPKVVAKPKDESKPTAITVRPSQAQSEAQAQPQPQPQPQSQAQWPDPPPMAQQQPAPGASSGSWAPSAGQVPWPPAPPSRSF